jgi:hypothetical protein
MKQKRASMMELLFYGYVFPTWFLYISLFLQQLTNFNVQFIHGLNAIEWTDKFLHSDDFAPVLLPAFHVQYNLPYFT